MLIILSSLTLALLVCWVSCSHAFFRLDCHQISRRDRKLFLLSSVQPTQDEIKEKIQKALESHETGSSNQVTIEHYEQIIPFLDGWQSSTMNNNLGIVLMDEQRYQEAQFRFEEAVRARRLNRNPYFNLAVLFSSKFGNYRRAWVHCARAVRIDPHQKDSLHLMGVILQELGYAEDSDIYFTRAEEQAKLEEDGAIVSPCPTVENLEIFNSKIGEVISSNVGGIMELEMTCISERPLIFIIPQLLNSDECDHILLRAASAVFEESKTRANCMTTQESEDTPSYRTSWTSWLNTDSVLRRLQGRIAGLTSLPLAYLMKRSEDLQVVKYLTNGRFNVHHDASAFHSRFMTTLIYLNSVDADFGGETWFPYAHENQANDSFAGTFLNSSQNLPNGDDAGVNEAISLALQNFGSHNGDPRSISGAVIRPVKGSALIFFNYSPTGVLDPYAVHAGLPVLANEKWVANYWLDLDLQSLEELLISG